MKKLLSVIVPAYNVSRYIEKCIASILAQTYTNIELIVVNDGSKDGTKHLIEQYLGDARLKYIEQQNAGVSAARNAGIDAASGELLAFVDSDDYIEPEMYMGLATALEQTGADVAVCNYNLIYKDRIAPMYSEIKNEVVNVTDDVYGYFAKYCACPKPNNYIWTRLYHTDMLKKSGVRFENYKLGDDTLFNFKLLPHINKVAFVEEGYYNYVQRADSNVYVAATKNNLAVVYADTFDALREYYEANGFHAYLQALPIHAFSRLRSVFFYSRLAGMCEDDILENIKAGFRGRMIYKYLTGMQNEI